MMTTSTTTRRIDHETLALGHDCGLLPDKSIHDVAQAVIRRLLDERDKI